LLSEEYSIIKKAFSYLNEGAHETNELFILFYTQDTNTSSELHKGFSQKKNNEYETV